jgi:hypothetical protein
MINITDRDLVPKRGDIQLQGINVTLHMGLNPLEAYSQTNMIPLGTLEAKTAIGIYKQQLMVARRIASINFRSTWNVDYNGDSNRCVITYFGQPSSAPAVFEGMLKWVPANPMYIIAGIRMKNSRVVRPYTVGDMLLITKSTENDDLYIPPLPNIHEDSKICMGDLTETELKRISEGTSILSVFDVLLDHFDNSSWNTDLFGSEKRELMAKMVRFNGNGQQYELKPATELKLMKRYDAWDEENEGEEEAEERKANCNPLCALLDMI